MKITRTLTLTIDVDDEHVDDDFNIGVETSVRWANVDPASVTWRDASALPEPHYYDVEVLFNPGSLRSYWAPQGDEEPCNTREGAEGLMSAMIEAGHSPENLRLVETKVVR